MNILSKLTADVFDWICQSTWQAAVLAALVVFVQLMFRKKLSPAWRYGLWFLLVARLVMPVSPRSAISVFNLAKLPPPSANTPAHGPEPKAAVETRLPESRLAPGPDEVRLSGGPAAPEAGTAAPEPVALTAAGAMAANRVVSKPPTNWTGIASAVWFGGVVLLSLRLFWAHVRFRSRLRRQVPVADEKFLQLFQNCAGLLRIRDHVTVIETDEVESPAVFGLRRKRLLLPDGVFERYTTDELRHIFLHELAHIKRRDLEVNWLITLLQILHWFNPVLWVAFARMRADRELATDALALAHTRATENVRYGETILKVVEALTRPSVRPGLVGIAESKARIKERLLAIARSGSVRPWRWTAAGLAVILAGVGLTGAQQTRVSPREAASQAIDRLQSAASSPAPPPDTGRQRFVIQVLDYDTGTALTGTTVTFTLDHFGAKSETREVLTDKDGRAAIDCSFPDLKRLAYEARKTNYLALHGQWYDQDLASLENEYQIKLSQGVEIGGTVTDENGKPVAGAEVMFDEPMNMILSAPPFRLYYAEMWSAPSGRQVATTDRDGKWRAKCIWPTVHWASLRVHHPDYADATCSTDLTSAMEAAGRGKKVSFDDLRQRSVRMTLTKGVVVNGRVVNEAGAPLAGIQVRYAELLISPHGRDQLLGVRSVVTDSAGKFRLEHMPPRHLFFAVQTNGFAPAVAELDPKVTDSEIELQLAKGRKLAGVTVDPQGNPIVGAHVAFYDFGIWRGIRWETMTDDRGQFAWAEAPAERFQLEIQKDGFITQRKTLQVADEKPVSVRLNRTLHLTGRVRDADTKEPVKNFRIDWLDRSDPEDFSRGQQYFSVAGSDGAYALDLGRLNARTWYGGYAHDFIFRVEADGYAPFVSRAFSSRKGDVADVTYDLDLKLTPQIVGTVVDAGGRPVAGAQVAVRTRASELYLSGKPRLEGQSATHMTDGQGHFQLNFEPAAIALIAAHESGFAQLETNEITTNVTVHLRPWSRIEGTAWKYDQPVTNHEVSSSIMWDESTAWSRRTHFKGTTDEHGKFSLAFVPPGKFVVFVDRMRAAVFAKAGETSVVKIGGAGRPVVGRYKIKNPYVEIEWGKSMDTYMFSTVTPQPAAPLKSSADYQAWRKQPEIERAFDNQQMYRVNCGKDGSFQMDQVVPGTYRMLVWLYDPRERDAMAYSKYIAKYEGTFEVPTNPANTHNPFDLGEIEISLTPQIVKGETLAPEFEATDMSDHKFKLADFHGKYVLLDFWATWCAPCIGEFSYLKQVHEKFQDRKDFAIISLSIDQDIQEPREFLKKNELPWTQGHVDDRSGEGLPSKYGVQGIPAVFLVSPDGKIVETDLEGSSMIGRLEKYLK